MLYSEKLIDRFGLSRSFYLKLKLEKLLYLMYEYTGLDGKEDIWWRFHNIYRRERHCFKGKLVNY